MKKIALTSAVVALMTYHAAAFADQNMGGMKGMQMEKMPSAAGAKDATHTAKGTVKKVDAKAGVVTLAHGPVNSLNWPPMTMGFKVKDKALLPKFAEGKSVEFDFVQSNGDYVITAVK